MTNNRYCFFAIMSCLFASTSALSSWEDNCSKLSGLTARMYEHEETTLRNTQELMELSHAELVKAVNGPSMAAAEELKLLAKPIFAMAQTLEIPFDAEMLNNLVGGVEHVIEKTMVVQMLCVQIKQYQANNREL